VLGERFVVQDCLGGNDRAALYRARDNASGGELRVVQVLRRDAIGDGVAIRRFVAERAALLTLLHDNLVTIEDIAVDSATVTIVSEHIVGPDLNRLRHEYGGTLPPALAVDLARQVLLGLSALHAIGLVHTDVRPGSVLVPRIVEPGEARLAGAALGRIGRGGQGRLDRLPRPVAFTAPEVLLGGRPTAASDVYAVGVLLYEALTGRTPFAGTSDLIAGGEIELAPPRPPAVPDELWAILAMMLTKDPAGRPSSAVSVADGLGAIAPDFSLLGPAAPMANPDPWSLRPAVAPAQRRASASVAAVPAGAAIGNAGHQATATAAPVPLPAGPVPAAAGAGTLTPRRRVLVSAGAASVVALGALAGIVTVSGEHKPHDVAATLPFADESYSTGAVVVSRTWSLSTTGDRLHGQVSIRRTAAGGPADVPEWLPSQLAGDQVSVSHGVQKQTEAGAAVLQLSAPHTVGRTVTYTYDVDTHAGPATVARLQGWAVNQAVQAAELRADLGQPQPDTVAALSVNTPAVALTTQGVRYPLALVGGDNIGQVADSAALVRTAYASDDPSVAVVDAHGVVQPRHPGTTVVTARLGPLAATATVLVTDPKKQNDLQFVRTSEGQVVVDAKPTAPAQPTMVTAHAGNGSALVIWSRPDDGGKPITSYDVFADGRKVATASDTHTTIRGLDRNHSYRFTVVARNALGDSHPSPLSKPIVPSGTSTDPAGCLPTAPTKLSASLVGRTTVHVSWQAPPTRKGCAVSAVRIQSFPPSRTVLAAPGATSVDIPGLDTATQYDFAVTAAFGQDPPQTSTRSTPVQTNSAPCWDGSYADPCPAKSSGDQTVAAPISGPAPTQPVAVAVVPSVGPTPTPVEPPSSPVPASSAPGVIPPTTTAPITTSPPPTATQTPPVGSPTTPPTDNPTQPPTSTEPVPTTSEPPPPGDTSDSPPPGDASAPADPTSTPTDTPSS
jgi:serine/threonine-protein kinase